MHILNFEEAQRSHGWNFISLLISIKCPPSYYRRVIHVNSPRWEPLAVRTETQYDRFMHNLSPSTCFVLLPTLKGYSTSGETCRGESTYDYFLAVSWSQMNYEKKRYVGRHQYQLALFGYETHIGLSLAVVAIDHERPKRSRTRKMLVRAELGCLVRKNYHLRLQNTMHSKGGSIRYKSLLQYFVSAHLDNVSCRCRR